MDALDQVIACKKKLGLDPDACYPVGYDNSCDAYERDLRKCLAMASCKQLAQVFYDLSQPRATRVAVNTDLQAPSW